MAKITAIVLLLCSAWACGRTPTSFINRIRARDAGPVDAQTTNDAQVQDAQIFDADIGDAGLIDVGSPDSGVVETGVVDAGLPVCETGPLLFRMEIASRTGQIFEEIGFVEAIDPLIVQLDSGQAVIVNFDGEIPLSPQRINTEVSLTLFRGGGSRDLIIGLFFGDQGSEGLTIAWSGRREFVEQSIQAFTHQTPSGCAPIVDECGELLPLDIRLGDGPRVEAGTQTNMSGQRILNSRESATYVDTPTCDDVEPDHVAGFVTDD